MSALSARRKTLTIYRYLTGPDDVSFCHRVTKALAEGWALYGTPTLTFDGVKNRVVCGQAITKDVEGIDYTPDLDLSAQ